VVFDLDSVKTLCFTTSMAATTTYTTTEEGLMGIYFIRILDSATGLVLDSEEYPARAFSPEEIEREAERMATAPGAPARESLRIRITLESL
jgi:hypothetical protein